jgi:hypothetical protein
MSIISGKPYKILHRESRLALDLSKDHKSILGEHNEPVNTQTVRITFPVNTYRSTHAFVVDPRICPGRGTYQIKGKRTLHWI